MKLDEHNASYAISLQTIDKSDCRVMHFYQANRETYTENVHYSGLGSIYNNISYVSSSQSISIFMNAYGPEYINGGY